MIRTQLHLKPRPGRVQDVLDFYAIRGVLTRSIAQPGCMAAEIRVQLPDQDCVVVSALWESESAYQAWLQNPDRALDVAELNPLLDHTDGRLGEAELSTIHDFRTARPGSKPTEPPTVIFQSEAIQTIRETK